MLKKETCKLYRNFYEIIHPSISRKNISEYRIIFQEEMISVQIFYPNKEIELDHIMIYIPGSSTYPDYYEKLAVKTNQIVILLDDNSNKKEDYEKIINYIIEESLKCNIDFDNITIISDFHGTDYLLELEGNFYDKKVKKIRKILLSPYKEDLTQYSLTNTLILSNNEAQKYSYMINYDLIKESIYDFIKDNNCAENDGVYLKITNYINGKEE